MYGERRFVDFQVDITIMLHMVGYGAARLGKWLLNHIHNMNRAEVINASFPDSSDEIDYRYMHVYTSTQSAFALALF